jgi:DMSO/TMAO reductase YedYZ molybdopterin-dependent catalytic subunit
MSISRRGWIVGGVAAAAGAAGLTRVPGLVPPDHSGPYGLGETLNYGAHKLLASHSMAREFPRSAISEKPFANEIGPPLDDKFKAQQAAGFPDWKLTVDGLVARPGSFSVADLKKFPSRSQITHLACEEGWSYIAEWIGAPLSAVLDAVGIRPEAKYVVYFSSQKEWWDSVDRTEAEHPQTLLAYGMNGGELPVAFGGPLRMRVPRQLGYKSVKFISRLTVTDDITKFGKGLGSASPEGGYAWFAGI